MAREVLGFFADLVGNLADLREDVTLSDPGCVCATGLADSREDVTMRGYLPSPTKCLAGSREDVTARPGPAPGRHGPRRLT